jgi:hypothetical protein
MVYVTQILTLRVRILIVYHYNRVPFSINRVQIEKKDIYPNINTKYHKKSRSTRISIPTFLTFYTLSTFTTFPTFLSYHDSGIGSTPHEKVVKGFNTFLEEIVTYPRKKTDEKVLIVR